MCEIHKTTVGLSLFLGSTHGQQMDVGTLHIPFLLEQFVMYASGRLILPVFLSCFY